MSERAERRSGRMEAQSDSADGVIERTQHGHVVRFVRHLRHPAATVWAALTEPEARAAWFFAGRLDLAPGGAVELSDSEYGITGEVTAVEPGRLLEFSWRSKDAPEHSTVRFELADGATGTVLTFSHTVDEHANPDRLATGWHLLFDALPRHLAGEPIEPSGSFQELRTQYSDLLHR